jgi:hypothetical protein
MGAFTFFLFNKGGTRLLLGNSLGVLGITFNGKPPGKLLFKNLIGILFCRSVSYCPAAVNGALSFGWYYLTFLTGLLDGDYSY